LFKGFMVGAAVLIALKRNYKRTRILTLSIAEFSSFTEAIERLVLG